VRRAAVVVVLRRRPQGGRVAEAAQFFHLADELLGEGDLGPEVALFGQLGAESVERASRTIYRRHKQIIFASMKKKSSLMRTTLTLTQILKGIVKVPSNNSSLLEKPET
jgi:hypothetical protein